MSKKPLTAMILMILILQMVIVSAGAEQPNPLVIDPALEYRLSIADSDDRIEVLIQFQDEVTRRDLAELSNLGFDVHHHFSVLPGLFATGTKTAIEELSNYQRTFWIEYNAPMQYYMNQTKYTIESQAVWLSQIRDGDHVSDPINGSGVTIVVLDSGIDGTHPDLDYTPVNIEAGQRPEPGQKVIFNVKKDQNAVGEPFIPFKNTDTTSGHGTHCAGTVAGDGSASAGRVVGVAPGAWLVGVSMGELFATIDETSGLEWVYEHSRPEDNPANIRVVTNSWGPGYPFDSLDSNDASVQLIEKLTHENNVAVVFAAGNDGADDHDGSSDTVNIFAKVPSAIAVAASTRDGNGMASFSSRGDKTLVETWPDIAAPGVGIWSASARATMIGGGVGLMDLTRDEKDPFYIAISGTSMATPHVAGLVALLWEACPSMTMSESYEDYEGDTPIIIEDNSGNLNDGPYQFDDLRIHETELILKLTADRIPIVPGNGVPDGNQSTIKGLNGRTVDYAQGYGLVNAKKAVALALKLQDMRDPDGDGVVDNPDVSVWDAFGKHKKLIREGSYSKKTDRITHSWEGQFVDSDSVLAEESSVYEDTVPTSNQKHSVFIPEETMTLTVKLVYYPVYYKYEGITDLPEGSYGLLFFTIDVDEDGEYDYPGDLTIPTVIQAINPSEKQTVRLDIDFTEEEFENYKGRNWTFDTLGYGWGIGGIFWDPLIGKGTRIDYSMDLQYRLDVEDDPRIPFSDFWFDDPSTQYYDGKIRLQQNWYVIEDKDDEDTFLDLSPEVGISFMLILVVLLTGGWLNLKRKFGFIGSRPDNDSVEWEIPENK
jgi:serine protease AprX